MKACRLRDLLETDEGWGRSEGRRTFGRLLELIECSPQATVTPVSLAGVRRIDVSFAGESLVEIARRFRGSRAILLTNVDDADIIANIDAAAAHKQQPLFVRNTLGLRCLGRKPSPGTQAAFEFALKHQKVRAAQFANSSKALSIQNASMKFKHLWEQGFLLREEISADSGGVEYLYSSIA